MAKIKYSPLVSDARGKFGNAVFSANKSGSYLRELVQPSNPNTAAQRNVRNLFGSIAAGWKGLTEQERDSWRQYAKDFSQSDVFGANVVLSGFQLYTKLNNSLSQAGFSTITRPEAPAQNPPINTWIDKNVGNGLTIDIGISDPDFVSRQGSAIVVSVAGPFSVGRSSAMKTEYKQQAVISTDEAITAAMFPANITGETNFARYGMAANQKYFVKVEELDIYSGWRSNTEIHEVLSNDLFDFGSTGGGGSYGGGGG